MSVSDIRSDNLAPLRTAMARRPNMTVSALPRQFWLVIDANFIYEELSFLTEGRKNPTARTALQELIDAGTVIAYAPDWLGEEVAEHLPEWAEQFGVSADRLSEIWHAYQTAYLRFIAVAQDSAVAPQPLADLDDWPYIAVYHALGAQAVVGRDKHIPRMGATQIGLETLKDLLTYARAESIALTIEIGQHSAICLVRWSGALLVYMARSMIGAIAQLPPWAQLAFLGGVSAALLHPRSRATLAQWVHSGQAAAPGAVARLCATYLEIMQIKLQKEAQAAAALHRVEARLPLQRCRLETLAFGVCAMAGRPLTVAEITERVVVSGYVSRSAYFGGYLRRVLRGSPRLTRGADRRWAAVLPIG